MNQQALSFHFLRFRCRFFFPSQATTTNCGKLVRDCARYFTTKRLLLFNLIVLHNGDFND